MPVAVVERAVLQLQVSCRHCRLRPWVSAAWWYQPVTGAVQPLAYWPWQRGWLRQAQAQVPRWQLSHHLPLGVHPLPVRLVQAPSMSVPGLPLWVPGLLLPGQAQKPFVLLVLVRANCCQRWMTTSSTLQQVQVRQPQVRVPALRRP